MQYHANELRTIAVRTLDEVHQIALQLRPSALDDLGLAAAIERYVADCRRHSGLEIDLVIRGIDEARLPTEIETALYRIVQESLTNVIRHAKAHTVSVLIERYTQPRLEVRVVIEDDGCGFDPSTAGTANQRLGLYGMRERAQLLRGDLTIESGTTMGTSIFVNIPLTPFEDRN
jgi:signal transduction histidine kinase